MNLNLVSELFELIAQAREKIPARTKILRLNKSFLNSISSDSKMIKVAFDTRRIDQSIQIIPRRGLQNYNRSESFLSEGMSQKIKNLFKIKDILLKLKEKYQKESEWQDSNARILLSTLEKGLRSDYQDGDYTESQPGVGSLDYIEELLHVRYRIILDDIVNIADSEIEKSILSKDEALINKDINYLYDAPKKDMLIQTSDGLIEKLFGGIKATKENKNVERTVTITIKDTYLGDK